MGKRGLFWQYNKGEWATEIQDAIKCYHTKFDKPPNVCYIRQAEEDTENGIRVIVDKSITPGHFLLCWEREESNGKA